MHSRFSNRFSKWLPWLLHGLAGLVALVFFSVSGPLPQHGEFLQFADRRPWLGIPNFGDVSSNGLLLLSGLAGFWMAARRRVASTSNSLNGAGFHCPWERGLFLVFFLSVCLTAVGSAYFHWVPEVPRLFWDRLPLSLLVVLMPAILIAERTALTRDGKAALVLWAALAPAAVVYWIMGENVGAGDLRPYWITQVAGMVAGGIGLLWLPARFTRARDYWRAFALYGLSRLCEHWDKPIFAMTGWISGHTLKHGVSALAVWLLAEMVRRRVARPEN